MHTLVIRRDLVEQHPVADAVYRAFCDSRDVALQRYEDGRRGQHSNWMIPWLTPLHDDNRGLLGDDYWTNGVEANRTTIDTFLRYSFEQGISKTRLTCEDIFIPDLLDT